MVTAVAARPGGLDRLLAAAAAGSPEAPCRWTAAAAAGSPKAPCRRTAAAAAGAGGCCDVVAAAAGGPPRPGRPAGAAAEGPLRVGALAAAAAAAAAASAAAADGPLRPGMLAGADSSRCGAGSSVRDMVGAASACCMRPATPRMLAATCLQADKMFGVDGGDSVPSLQTERGHSSRSNDAEATAGLTCWRAGCEEGGWLGLPGGAGWRCG